ncbi:MAG: insulinase family protein [Fibrella sp.]|nr:insulinase family protein [Armatimonadota bacterium]
MNIKKLICTSFVVVASLHLSKNLVSPVWAQESTPGAATTPPPSTVVKNRSPIEVKPLEVKLPSAKEGTLPNGTRVFIVEDHRTPLVTFTVSMRAGELFETPDKRGVADLVASTLTEGTKSHTADQIAALTDKYGASFSAGAGDEKVTISLRCLAENADILLPILAELVYEPVFPDDRVQRVRARAQAGATSRQTDPNVLASDALRAALYGSETPYGRSSVTSDQIGLIAMSDLELFHGKHYRPDEAIIGVAGDVQDKEVLTLLSRVFGKQPKPDKAADSLPSATLILQNAMKASVQPAPVIINRPGSAQSVLTFGVPGIKRNDPDYFSLLLANRILGGGFNSRLNQKLREEKGYTYGARSSVSAPKWTGLWSASASVRNAVTGDAAKDFLGEFAKLQTNPPKEGELALIKQSLIGNFALTLESPEAVLARSIERFEYDLPADYWSNYANRVRAVSPSDVARVARKYWGAAGNPEAASTPRVWAIAVGEKSAIEQDVIKATADIPAP